MSISDERLRQLAYDPMMCNITPEVLQALREMVELRRVGQMLADALKDLGVDLLGPNAIPEWKRAALACAAWEELTK